SRTGWLNDEHDAIARSRTAGPKCHDTAPSNAGQSADGPLEVLRMIFATVDDDNVFDAAADEQFTITHVSEIARMQPPISNRLGSQCIVVEVTQHQRRPRECDFADGSLVHPPPVFVNNAAVVAGERGA